ncbi:hypothetical protein ES708_22486 [subsurface metagenome]
MCVAGIEASGSRGGYVSLAVAVPLVGILWIVRRLREDANSMAAVLVGSLFASFVIGFATLAVVWQKLRWKFTGGYEGAGSTDVRWLQWELAKPKIILSPLTGYGQGVGGNVVGYLTPSGVGTVDSYVITLLVDLGVPGFLFFCVMIIAAIWMLVRNYITDLDPASTSSLALIGALASFATYRIALSQAENHFLMFILLGLAVMQIAFSVRRCRDARSTTRELPSGLRASVPPSPLPQFSFPAAPAERRDLSRTTI